MVADAYASPLMDASQIAEHVAYPAPSLGCATSAAVLRLLNGRAGLTRRGHRK